MDKKKMPVQGMDWQRLAGDVFYTLLSGVLYTLCVAMFTVNANFAPGGITGLSVLFNHLIPQIPVGMASLILNVPVVILCYKSFGKVYMAKSLAVMALWAVMLDLLTPLIPAYTGDPLMSCLFAGVCLGLALGLVYRRGFCTGGTDFIAMPLKKKFPHLSIGALNLVIDGTVILLGGLVYGNIDAVLRGILMTVASTTLTDKLLYGSQSGKRLIIITDKGQEVADGILNQIQRGVTMTDVEGAYSHQTHKLLLCACSRPEVYRIKKLCYEIDKNALIMVGANDEVYGEGFMDIEG